VWRWPALDAQLFFAIGGSACGGQSCRNDAQEIQKTYLSYEFCAFIC